MENIMTIMGLLGFSLPVIGLIWLIIALFIKKSKKIPLILIAAGLISLSIGVIIASTKDNKDETDKSSDTKSVKEATTKKKNITFKVNGHENSDGDVELTADSSRKFKISGTASGISSVNVQQDFGDANEYSLKVKDGQFSKTLTLKSSHPKEAYFVKPSSDGNDNLTEVVVKSDNYTTESSIAAAKKESSARKATSISKSNSESTKKSNKSEKTTAFKDSIQALAKNSSDKTGVTGAITAKYDADAGLVTYYVPDSATDLTKSEKSTLANYLFTRTKKLASMSDVDEPTSMYIQTKDYDNIARTKLLGGTKIY